jgi:mono/diheme cytochrome c family protein
MPPPSRKNRAVLKLFFGLLLLFAGVAIIYATIQNSAQWSWPVPEEAKQLKNPVQISPAVLQSAKMLYDKRCADCHGDTGAGDGPKADRYDPRPADFTDPKLMNLTDGELFYKISEGKKPMPAFKTKLTEEQRWELVLFIRSFVHESSGSH